MTKSDSNKATTAGKTTKKKVSKKKVSKKKVSKKKVSTKKAAARTATKKVTASRRKKSVISDGERRMMVAVHAYYKWEKEGFPAGKDNHHWLEAEQEVKEMFK